MLASRIKVRGTYFYEATAAFNNGNLKQNSEVQLKHNPENLHDKNAVEIRLKISGAMLGHVSKDLAPKYAKLADRNLINKAYVSSLEFENNCIDLKVVVIYISEEYDDQTHISTSATPHIVNLPDKPGVYALKNKSTDSFYIGSSKNIKYRVATHIRELENGTHVNKPLQADYNRFGKKNFEAVILVEDIDIERLSFEEMTQITLHLNQGKSLYNMTEDGQGRPNPLYGLASISERNYRRRNKIQLSAKDIEELTAVLHAKAQEEHVEKTNTLTLIPFFRWIYNLFSKKTLSDK